MTIRYPLFDYLRLALASMVVISHAGLQPGGGVAVSGFLALSGFLISGSLERSANMWDFAKRRLLRVTPGLLLSLVVVLVLFGITAFRSAILYYFSFGFTGDTVNRALWSLPFEEAFYVGLAILFVFGFLSKRTTIAVGLALGLCGCLLGQFFTLQGSNQIHRALPLLWSLFVGVAAWQIKAKLERFRFLSLPLLVAGLVSARFGHDFAFAALFFAPGILLLGVGFKPKVSLPFDFSFGVYVLHMPILAFGAVMRWPLTITLPLVAAAAALSWYLIEKPATKLKNFKLRKGSASVSQPVNV